LREKIDENDGFLSSLELIADYNRSDTNLKTVK